MYSFVGQVNNKINTLHTSNQVPISTIVIVMTFFGIHSIYETTKEILTLMCATSFAKEPISVIKTISTVFFQGYTIHYLANSKHLTSYCLINPDTSYTT